MGVKLLLLVLRDGCGAGECAIWTTLSSEPLRRPLKEFPVLGVHALFAWKFGALFLYDLVSGSLFLGIWVLLGEYGTLDSSGDDFVRVHAWFDSGYGVCVSTWLWTNFTQFLRSRGLGS